MLTTLALVFLQQCPPPTVTLTINPGAGAVDINGNHLPRVSWVVNCPAQGGSCPNVPAANLADLRTEFAAMPSERLGFGTGFQGASGEGPLPGLSSYVMGAHVQFSALVECNNPGSAVRATSAPVVFAPTLNVGAPVVMTRAADDSITGLAPPQEIPLNTRVELRPSFAVVLAPNESATVRVQGAGVDWSKTYSFPDRRNADALSAAVTNDPAARFTFTQPGTVSMTVELAGVRSVPATFTVVSGGGSTGGGTGGGSTGGGTGGNTGAGGGGGMPSGGCSSAPGLVLLAALAFLRRR